MASAASEEEMIGKKKRETQRTKSTTNKKSVRVQCRRRPDWPTVMEDDDDEAGPTGACVCVCVSL